ncbi:MAG: diguanylate cyclase [Spirochaetaceae bacterium]|nr:MAG: diguanylate cyclase [Spirochaetaceae bacterium]
MRLTARITITAVIPLVLILTLVVVQLNRSISYEREAAAREDQLKLALVRNNVTTLLNQLQSTAAILAGSAETARAVLASDVNFLQQWSELFHTPFVSRVLFTDSRGIVLARSDDQFRFSDNLSRQEPVSLALEGKQIRGFFVLDNTISLSVAQPILLYDELLIGTIVVEVRLSDDLMYRLARGTGAGVLIEFSDALFSSHAETNRVRGHSDIAFRYDPESLIPLRASVLFFEDEYVQRLRDLQFRFISFIVLLALGLPAVLVFILRAYLRPYARLIEGLVKLSGGRETFAEVRASFEPLLAQPGHQAALIADAVSRFTRSMEESIDMLEKLSTTDQLTGLRNRRSIETTLRDEIDRVTRYGGTFSLLLADIDNFKLVNDALGHPEGDRILQTVADIMTTNSRATDVVARWGGEEFIIHCSGTILEGAVELSDKLRRAVGDATYSDQWRGAPVGTLSIGVAEYEPGETAEALLSRVDTALYRAKQSGRDRVEIARSN